MNEFEKAYKELPAYCNGYDSLYHKTANDLAWLVLLQIDLFDEGEDSEIRNIRQYNQCKKYVKKWCKDKIFN